MNNGKLQEISKLLLVARLEYSVLYLQMTFLVISLPFNIFKLKLFCFVLCAFAESLKILELKAHFLNIFQFFTHAETKLCYICDANGYSYQPAHTVPHTNFVQS